MSCIARLLPLLAVALAACAPSGAPPERPAPPAVAPSAPAPSAVGPGSAAQASAPARSPDRLRVAIAADAALYGPHFIAVEKGYYAEEGIELELVRLPGGAATTALIAGELHYSTSAGAAVNAMLHGAPLRVIYTNADRPLHEIWSSSADVRTLADLPGKTLGVPSRGDANEVSARMVLQQHGVDPNAIGYVAVGGGGQRLGAIQAGSVAAAVLPIADVVLLRDALPRGQRLVSLHDEVRLLYTGVVSHEKELGENRERARRFLRATVKGREYHRANRESVLDILGQYNALPRAVNEVDYDLTLPSMTEDGSMPIDVQQRDTALRAEMAGVDQPPPVERLYDYSLIQETYASLRASGWQPSK